MAEEVENARAEALLQAQKEVERVEVQQRVADTAENWAQVSC